MGVTQKALPTIQIGNLTYICMAMHFNFVQLILTPGEKHF